MDRFEAMSRNLFGHVSLGLPRRKTIIHLDLSAECIDQHFHSQIFRKIAVKRLPQTGFSPPAKHVLCCLDLAGLIVCGTERPRSVHTCPILAKALAACLSDTFTSW